MSDVEYPEKRELPTNRRNRGVIKGWNACHDAFMSIINKDKPVKSEEGEIEELAIALSGGIDWWKELIEFDKSGLMAYARNAIKYGYSKQPPAQDKPAGELVALNEVEVGQQLARVFCDKAHALKELDSTLINDMAKSICQRFGVPADKPRQELEFAPDEIQVFNGVEYVMKAKVDAHCTPPAPVDKPMQELDKKVMLEIAQKHWTAGRFVCDMWEDGKFDIESYIDEIYLTFATPPAPRVPTEMELARMIYDSEPKQHCTQSLFEECKNSYINQAKYILSLINQKEKGNG